MVRRARGEGRGGEREFFFPLPTAHQERGSERERKEGRESHANAMRMGEKGQVGREKEGGTRPLADTRTVVYDMGSERRGKFLRLKWYRAFVGIELRIIAQPTLFKLFRTQ